MMGMARLIMRMISMIVPGGTVMMVVGLHMCHGDTRYN
jgi:hypothetical protein